MQERHFLLSELERLIGDEAGQDLAEYAISLSLIGLMMVIAVVLANQDWLPRIWEHVQDVQDLYLQ